MAKNQISRPAKPAAVTPQVTEQDKKDANSFFKWMIGITGLLILLMYYMFTKVM